MAIGSACGAIAGFGVALAAVGPNPNPGGPHGGVPEVLAYIFFPIIGGCIGAFIGGILGAIIVTIWKSSRDAQSAFGAMPSRAKNAKGRSVGEPAAAIILTSTECEQAAGRSRYSRVLLALVIGGVVAAGLIGVGTVFVPESHDDTEVTAAPLVVIRGPNGRLDSLVFSPNGKYIATVRNEPLSPDGEQKPGDVRIWDSRTGKEVQSFLGHKSQVLTLKFSPDGTRLAGACGEDQVKVWDVQTGKEVLNLSGNKSSVTTLAYSPDGKRIASAGGDIRIWDANSGKLLLTLSGDDVVGVDGVESVAFSPDGRHFATSRAMGIRVEVWDLNTLTKVRAFSGTQMMFSPDGNEMSMRDWSGNWCILDVATWEKKNWALPALERNALVIRPDWQHLAALLYKPNMGWLLRVLDTETGRPLYSFTHIVGSDRPRLAFSIDGDQVAVGTGGSNLPIEVSIWETRGLTK
jgi:WD40 repeat protein